MTRIAVIHPEKTKLSHLSRVEWGRKASVTKLYIPGSKKVNWCFSLHTPLGRRTIQPAKLTSKSHQLTRLQNDGKHHWSNKQRQRRWKIAHFLQLNYRKRANSRLNRMRSQQCQVRSSRQHFLVVLFWRKTHLLLPRPNRQGITVPGLRKDELGLLHVKYLSSVIVWGEDILEGHLSKGGGLAGIALLYHKC